MGTVLLILLPTFIFACGPERGKPYRLPGHSRTRDVDPEVTPDALHEYLALWTCVAGIPLDQTRQDEVVWSWETNGIYTMRPAYAAKFWGREVDQTAEFTRKARAPLHCRFFAWLAQQNRCWTSDRLARRGLDYQDNYPLYNHEEESIDHLFIRCVFTRKLWAVIFQAMDKPCWVPTMNDTLAGWRAAQNTNETHKIVLNALRVLAMWEIWKHRNAFVLEGASPSVTYVLRHFAEEGRNWKQAGLLKGDLAGFFNRVERQVSTTS